MAFSPGTNTSTNGLFCGISDNAIPGTLSDWQKYCILGALAKFNVNLLGCSIFGFVGFLLNAVICLFITKKKRHRSASFKYPLNGV
jgi:hypothetical protein